MNPGIYTMPAEQYHADPCDEPSMSASLIKALVNQSPLHAWSMHPRLNKNAESKQASNFDIGSSAHALILEGVDSMCVIDADDWRTKAAKEQRDAARDDGRIPVLAKNYKDINDMVEVANNAIARCEDLSGITLRDGKPEQTLIWQEDGVWCRARADWLHNEHIIMMEYKTTSGTASPDMAARQILNQLDGDVQAGFYLRGLEKLTGKQAKFVFMVQEIEAPYAVSFIGVSPAYLALGDDKVRASLALFKECMRRNEWPGYERRIRWEEPTAWTLEKWYQKQNEAAQNDSQAIQE